MNTTKPTKTLQRVAQNLAAAAAVAAIAATVQVGAAQAGTATQKPLQRAKISDVIQGRETYMRFALGADFDGLDEGFWQGHDAGVPVVYFDLDSSRAAYAAAAIGTTYRPGLRGELSLNVFANKDVSGTWSYTVPTVAGPHADVSAKVRSTALMANVVYAPLEAQGDKRRFQPFVTAGLGLSINKMGDWTRTNLALVAPERPVRTFEGDRNLDLALMVGVGGSYQVNRSKARPVHLEVMYQYFDLGKAVGGETPLPGFGNSTPQIPLTIDTKAHVVSFGLRIPFN